MSCSATSPVAIWLIILLAGTICSNGEESKIVGGKPVEPPNKYPWLVQMRVGDKIGECNGVIFDKRWVITSQVCIGVIAQGQLDHIHWVTALHSRTDLDPYSQVVKSVEAVNHSAFGHIESSGVYSFVHDIAMVRVAPYFIFNQKVAPVNLPPCDWDIGNDTQYMGTVAGWGWNETTGAGRRRRSAEPKKTTTPVLNEVQMPILSTRTCQRLLGYFEHEGKNKSMVITDDHICAGDVKNGGKSFCSGDLGGPLMIYNETSLLWTMVGIASNSYGCALKKLPNIFTKVSKYVEFFVHVTQRCKARVIDNGMGGGMGAGMRTGMGGKGKHGGKAGSAIGAGIGAGVIPEY